MLPPSSVTQALNSSSVKISFNFSVSCSLLFKSSSENSSSTSHLMVANSFDKKACSLCSSKRGARVLAPRNDNVLPYRGWRKCLQRCLNQTPNQPLFFHPPWGHREYCLIYHP